MPSPAPELSLQQRIDLAAKAPVAPGRLLIDGLWIEGQDGEAPVISPLTGKVLTTLSQSSAADVDRAVASARRAFDDGRWRALPPAGRAKILHRLADLIDQHALDLAVLGVRDNGTEISMALKAEPGSAAATFRYYAEAIDKVYGQIAPTADTILALIHRDPVGVVAAIVPWNFPLMIGAWKIAPALAAGNSVVLKPAESASLSLLKLADLALQAGVPPGVFNVVPGPGHITGQALSLSMEVDVLAFTGSGATGRRLLQASAQSNLKRCYLELGGKSPNIIFADAPDLGAAARSAATAIFRNAGQVCVAGSRLLVQDDVADEVIAALLAATHALTRGDPMDLSTQIGAVHSADQLSANLDFVAQAQTEGATIATGGARDLVDSGGFFMQPTVVTGVKPTDRLFQQEVFGPVLAVTRFKDEAEALHLANATSFGLASGVWTANLSRAHRMIRGLRAGVVHVNTYGGSDNTVPLGGVKQSGNGQDKSLHALDKYTNLKTAWIQL